MRASVVVNSLLLLAPDSKSSAFDWSMFLDTTSTIAGVVGLVIAILAYVKASREATRADLALIRERRIVFELEILRDLTEYATGGGQLFGRFETAGPKVRALLSMLPAAELPLLRAYGASTRTIPFPEVADAAREADLTQPVNWKDAEALIVDELNAAVLRRVSIPAT